MVHGGLQHLSPQRRAVAAKALFLCRSIMRARQTSQATLFDGFKALMLQKSDMLLTVLASGMEGGGERRIAHRALAKWRGSTLSGYLRAGDDQTYLDSWRTSGAPSKDLMPSCTSYVVANWMVHLRSCPEAPTGARCAARCRLARRRIRLRDCTRWLRHCMLQVKVE